MLLAINRHLTTMLMLLSGMCLAAGCQREATPPALAQTDLLQNDVAAPDHKSSEAQPLPPLKAGKLPPLFEAADNKANPDTPADALSALEFVIWRQDPKDRARIAEIAAREDAKPHPVDDAGPMFPYIPAAELIELDRDFRERLGSWTDAATEVWENFSDAEAGVSGAPLKEHELPSAAIKGLRRILDAEINVVNGRYLEESKPYIYFSINDERFELHHGLLTHQPSRRTIICWSNDDVKLLCEILMNQDEISFANVNQALKKIGQQGEKSIKRRDD